MQSKTIFLIFLFFPAVLILSNCGLDGFEDAFGNIVTTGTTKKALIQISNIRHPRSASQLQEALKNLNGVTWVFIDDDEVRVDYSKNLTSLEQIKRTILDMGFKISKSSEV